MTALTRAPLAALLTASALWWSPASASADPSSPESAPDITDPSRVVRVAEELEEHPLYVHPSMRDALDPELIDDLSARVDGGFPDGTPLYAVVQPSVVSDETAGQPASFLQALHEETGADGVYVAITRDLRFATAAFDSTVVPEVDEDQLAWSPIPLEMLDEVLDQVLESPSTDAPTTQLAPAAEPDPEGGPPAPRGGAWRFWQDFPTGLLLGGVSALLFLALSWGLKRRWWLPGRFPLLSRTAELLRGRFGWKARPGPFPGTRSTPNRVHRWRLRPILALELRSLRSRIERTPHDHPALGRAREAYDAAGLIAASARLPASALVCAIVFARHGERFLDSPGEPLALPCEVNPLHGAAARRRRLRLRGRTRRWTACDHCTSDEAQSLDPLMVRAGCFGRPGTPFRDLDDPWARTALYDRDPFERARRQIGV